MGVQSMASLLGAALTRGKLAKRKPDIVTLQKVSAREAALPTLALQGISYDGAAFVRSVSVWSCFTGHGRPRVPRCGESSLRWAA